MVVDCNSVRIFSNSSTREQSNKRSGTRLKTESERLARFALKTLTPCFTDFFTDFEKKTDCFAVYRGRNFRVGVSKTRGRVRDRGGVFKGCFFRVKFRIRVRVRVILTLRQHSF